MPHDLLQYPNTPLGEREALMMSPTRLAYVGDAVHHLYIRTALVCGGSKMNAIHQHAVDHVNAAAQAHALKRVECMLSETETDVVRRGRNAHAHHPTRKRTASADYAQSTGIEALLGYLYLTGRMERLMEILGAMRAAEA